MDSSTIHSFQRSMRLRDERDARDDLNLLHPAGQPFWQSVCGQTALCFGRLYWNGTSERANTSAEVYPQTKHGEAHNRSRWIAHCVIPPAIGAIRTTDSAFGPQRYHPAGNIVPAMLGTQNIRNPMEKMGAGSHLQSQNEGCRMRKQTESRS